MHDCYMTLNSIFKYSQIAFFFTLFSCVDSNTETSDLTESDAPVFKLMNPDLTGIKFTNTSVESLERNFGHYDYFYNGGGVGLGDFNNDGLQDVFLAGNDASSKLYQNLGEFKFKDVTLQSGIANHKWATGVTVVDINDDGLLDIYVANSGPNLEDDKLSNQLFVNQGGMKFVEQAALYGIDDSSYSTQGVFFDIDHDSDLDLLVVNHSLFNYGSSPQEWEMALKSSSSDVYKKSCNTLYRNEGNGQFVDITESSGIFRPGFGLGAAVSDLNQDGHLDVYITNDYYVPDFVFYGNGNGSFREDAKSTLGHSSYYAMGCDVADYNNDGLVDLVVADMTPADHFRNKTLMESMNVELYNFLTNKMNFVPQYMFNTLQVNRGGGKFSEVGQMAGISKTDWSWATLLADFDNDSNKDLIVTNGFKRDTKNRDWLEELKARYNNEGKDIAIYYEQLLKADQRPINNYAFKNNGNLGFTNASVAWGFTQPTFSNGAAYGDLDNDGDLDLVINNLESSSFVYQNTTMDKGGSNYIQFELHNNGVRSSILNSKVRLFNQGEEQLVEYTFARGYQSSMQDVAHFGLGRSTGVERVLIQWPDGTETTINNPEINKLHKIDKSQVAATPISQNSNRPLFFDITQQLPQQLPPHSENPFDDFAKEILLPHKYSTMGPAIATADVNGDGVEDIYLGGAKGQPGQIFLQNDQRGLIPNEQAAFLQDAGFEDLGAAFFDANSDGFPDLYVASGGGGDVQKSMALLQDRLYLNDGKGNFRKSSGLPKIQSSTSAIAALDYDNDGDQDLFVGGRNTPGAYPATPESYLLENNNGIFKNVTASKAPVAQRLGMITDVRWEDLNKDGKADLLLTGEWMGIVVLQQGEIFEDVSKIYGLNNTQGWWYSLNAGDFDGDGDTDFIAGNIGKNNKFNPSEEKPLHVFLNDFDDNGSLDIVLSKDYKGDLAPIRGKECSTQQMPFLADKYPQYTDFASSTLEDIYGAEKLKDALHLTAKTFSSVYIQNNGPGKAFTIKELPVAAQFGPIQDFVVYDFNKDGKLDIVAGGQIVNAEPETPAYDAGMGLFMYGLGNGEFLPLIDNTTSGLMLNKNCKKLEFIGLSSQNRPALVVANNNQQLQLYAWTK